MKYWEIKFQIVSAFFNHSAVQTACLVLWQTHWHLLTAFALQTKTISGILHRQDIALHSKKSGVKVGIERFQMLADIGFQ